MALGWGSCSSLPQRNCQTHTWGAHLVMPPGPPLVRGGGSYGVPLGLHLVCHTIGLFIFVGGDGSRHVDTAQGLPHIGLLRAPSGSPFSEAALDTVDLLAPGTTFTSGSPISEAALDTVDLLAMSVVPVSLGTPLFGGPSLVVCPSSAVFSG